MPKSKERHMKGKTALKVALAAVALICTGGVQAALGAVTETTELPEVEVVGKYLYEMRQEIIKAEDRFYALFNQLNKDDDFDSAMQAPLGTRLKSRVCRLQFYEKAQAERFLTATAPDPDQLLLAGTPDPDMLLLERKAEYKRKALAVINAHPELLRLIRERDALETKYNAAYRERFKGRWILFDRLPSSQER
jgi:hypothetical protein